jgi:glycosyltransferase involved in cell wall biosynthesis
MYPGTINWHQGLDIAVKAFDKIAGKYPDLEFHIYGDGPSKNEIDNLIQSLGLQKRVFLKGLVPFEKVPELMSDCDIGIIPKRNDSFGGEAFSTKSLEFMAMGVPIVISRTKIDNFYFNERVVCFFEPGDDNDLAQKLDLLLGRPENTERQAKAADAFVKRFQWQQNENIYMSILNKIV